MDVKQFYQEINGSYQNALSIMINDALIARMLSKFINNNSCDAIISNYEKKDFRALFESAHALKGVAGNLALTPLYDIACVLSDATRNDDNPDIAKEIQQLKEIYSCIKENYAKYLA